MASFLPGPYPALNFPASFFSLLAFSSFSPFLAKPEKIAISFNLWLKSIQTIVLTLPELYIFRFISCGEVEEIMGGEGEWEKWGLLFDPKSY